MNKLIPYQKYSRQEIHDIFSPNTTFQVGKGDWGISGIIKIPNTDHDYLLLVTYGQKQANYVFDENIDSSGVLTWQSQPSQKLTTPRIKELINHDETKNHLHLFLRTNKKEKYTYFGLLAYITHDNEREKPVHFKWQILNFDPNQAKKVVSLIKANEPLIDKIQANQFREKTNNKWEEKKIRKGRATEDFFHYSNINFEKEQKYKEKIGLLGEEIIALQEKEKLISKGRKDLAKKVKLTREIAGNAEKFDILSFDEFGNEKYIEVKTTTKELNTPYHISKKEVDFSSKYPEQYYFYRIYHLNIDNLTYGFQYQKGEIPVNSLEVETYVGKYEDL